MAIRSLPSGIRAAVPSGARLKPWPAIARDVFSGRPEASGEFPRRSSDRRRGGGRWQVTPGVLDTIYPWDETFSLLAGGVTITDQNGDSLVPRAGDQVFVPIGTVARWDVTETVRKVFHVRADEPVGDGDG